jgi:hypothetical protein
MASSPTDRQAVTPQPGDALLIDGDTNIGVAVGDAARRMRSRGDGCDRR